MATSKPIAIRLPVELEARLKSLSDRTGRPMSYYIREMIKIAIDELEDEVWAQEAVEEWVKSGKESFPFEEIQNKLGL
jgi:RHH-type rel operon transcriptional repressor/antitoxin RelB